jgi:ABC-type transport system involved in cytochrome c biogenesis permease subunit
MINIKIFAATAFVYLFSSMLYLCYFFFRQKRLGRAATLTAGCGVLLQTAAYGIRWIEGYNQGFTQTPFSFFTLYETLIFASWSMAITYLFIEYQYHSRALGAVITSPQCGELNGCEPPQGWPRSQVMVF